VNARRPAAVVAGNTETSSRIVDVVFSAFGDYACGQGTMNNVALGNDNFTYYETIGGGQGACADADGPSAVHVAMSNTLITPSKRSSSRTRCASSAGSCALDRAAEASTAVATAWCASCACSRIAGSPFWLSGGRTRRTAREAVPTARSVTRS
jgi:N-methylhydantoinase B/acetone carboxylase, alpha subunit